MVSIIIYCLILLIVIFMLNRAFVIALYSYIMICEVLE